MELQQIRCFLALAETLNFTRAAERCGISQPTLSRAVLKLEEEVGGKLIRRERNRTHLTELGLIMRPRLQQSLSLAEAALNEAQEFSRISSAKLVLGVMCTIGPNRLISLVDHIAKRVPQLQLTMRVASGDELLKMLEAGEIEVALLGLPCYPDIINAYPLYTERYMLAIPEGHRLLDFCTVPLKEVSGEPYLERLNCEFDDHYEHIHGECPIEVNVRFSSENEEWIQAMILAGLGCAIVPEFSVFQPGLLTRPLVEPEVHRTISLATVRGRPQKKSLMLFSRLCQSLAWD